MCNGIFGKVSSTKIIYESGPEKPRYSFPWIEQSGTSFGLPVRQFNLDSLCVEASSIATSNLGQVQFFHHVVLATRAS